MSHLTHSMVEQFFAREEENARGVLRKEMDSAMDTIFKQMKRKLMMLVESGDLANATGHGLAHLGEPIGQQQLYESSNQIISTSTNSYVPDNANSNQNDEIIVKNELGKFVNIVPNEPIPTSPTKTQPSNEQSNDIDDDLFNELDDDEEDCDCSECIGDLFVVKEEGDDQNDDDDSQSTEDLLDESNDSISRPTKRARLENDQVHDQAQPSNKFITISLKCPQCSQMFEDKDKLNAHLKSVHSILKYRCLYKDCKRSFDKQMDLTGHYSTAHPKQPNTMWPCGYCSGQYKGSLVLLKHHWLYHEEGVFQCAHPDCQFVAELKQSVLSHFGTNHKELVCQYPGCAKRYPIASILKAHERTHLNAKPYRCKWPKCEYTGSAYKHMLSCH